MVSRTVPSSSRNTDGSICLAQGYAKEALNGPEGVSAEATPSLCDLSGMQ